MSDSQLKCDAASPDEASLSPDVPEELVAPLRASVGERTLAEIEQATRRVMVMEALARAGGTKAGAARILGVSRQFLQHILRGQKRLHPRP